MADRGAHRGRGSGHRGTGVGGGFRGGRGGGRGGQGGGGPGTGHGQGGAAGERPKKENILDLAKYKDKKITVKFNGGREGELLHLHMGDLVTNRGKFSVGEDAILFFGSILGSDQYGRLTWPGCSDRHFEGLRRAHELGLG